MSIFQAYNRISEYLDISRIIKDAPMKEHTSFKVGGNTALLIMPQSIDELLFVISVCKLHNVKYYILGNGTNLIVKDSGYDGVIIKLSEFFNKISIEGNRITAQAGALISAVSAKAAQNALSGLEFASGIPGTVGGAIVMNAGAYGGEMSQVVERVKAFDSEGNIVELTEAELKFSYRNSIFQERPYIVLEAEMKLENGDMEIIKNTMKDFTERRTKKQPLSYPSAGSIFKRPEGYYAGKLIEEAGLKGLALGGARVSPLHAGFIINEGNATSEDIIDLIAVVQSTVNEKFNVMLEPEVKILGSD